jgi:hypothetical protein
MLGTEKEEDTEAQLETRARDGSGRDGPQLPGATLKGRITAPGEHSAVISSDAVTGDRTPMEVPCS